MTEKEHEKNNPSRLQLLWQEKSLIPLLEKNLRQKSVKRASITTEKEHEKKPPTKPSRLQPLGQEKSLIPL